MDARAAPSGERRMTCCNRRRKAVMSSSSALRNLRCRWRSTAQLFGTGSSAQDRAERRKVNRSILDGITHDVARLQKNLNPADRSRLSTYLDNVREIERRIQAIEQYNLNNPKREIPTAPIGVPDSWEDLTRLRSDLPLLACT